MLREEVYLALVQAALKEDIGAGDCTSIAVIPENAIMQATMHSREAGVICGLPLAEAAFKLVSPAIKLQRLVTEGSAIAAGTPLLLLKGNARDILAAERVALNFLQYLSGIATKTAQYVAAIRGTKAILLDTRKTLPTFRVLAKYATRIGGAENHRFGLADGVLIKDNHILYAGGIEKAVQHAVAAGHHFIEIECDTIEQVQQAFAAKVSRILLDNMDIPMLQEAVRFTQGKVQLEASGGITLKNIRAVAETGVDFISVGALTHSVKALDIGLDSF